jgi:hypothetical protein
MFRNDGRKSVFRYHHVDGTHLLACAAKPRGLNVCNGPYRLHTLRKTTHRMPRPRYRSLRRSGRLRRGSSKPRAIILGSLEILFSGVPWINCLCSALSKPQPPEYPVRRPIYIIGLLIALGATPGFAQSGGGSGGAGSGGGAGAGSASGTAGTGSASVSSVAGTGSNPGGVETGPTGGPPASNPGPTGTSRAGVTGDPNIPASGGAVSQSSASNSGNMGLSGPGIQSNNNANNESTAPTPAAAIAQRQRAAGVAAPPATQRGEEATLDQLDQKLEATSGIAPRCPPTVTNCPRQ